MAKNITGQVVGGRPQTLAEAFTVQNVFDALGLDGTYTATVNGESAELSASIADFSFISFAEKVKGGACN